MTGDSRIPDTIHFSNHLANPDSPFGLSTLLRSFIDTREGTTGEVLHTLLRAARLHLGMDIGFIAEFENGRRTFRHLDQADGHHLLQVGASDPLDDSYCQRVVDGRLPQLIHNAMELPAARALPVTEAIGLGAHISVPIRLPDGNLFGTFCCFSFRGDHTLGDRDLSMMYAFADIAGALIGKDIDASRELAEKRKRIEGLLGGEGFYMAWQPIVDVASRRIAGVEALARFSARPPRTPDAWFREAAEVNLAPQLETRAIEKSLAILEHLPADAYLTCNVSARAFIEGTVIDLLEKNPLDRIVLEITEHDVVNDYEVLARSLQPLRARGLRLAVDDAGAGYSSLRHVLMLAPDLIKLDVSLTRDIDADGARQAMVNAMVHFAEGTHCRLVAEGVETQRELDTLRRLGVTHIQGYFLHRPLSMKELLLLL